MRTYKAEACREYHRKANGEKIRNTQENAYTQAQGCSIERGRGETRERVNLLGMTCSKRH
eukprot:4087963-Amphidinium_carterae.2